MFTFHLPSALPTSRKTDPLNAALAWQLESVHLGMGVIPGLFAPHSAKPLQEGKGVLVYLLIC